MFIQTEATPNPATLKFLPGREVLSVGTADFPNPQTGGTSPLARRLLRLFIELNRLGTAVIIATHDVNLMEQVEARRMVLANGRLDVYD